VKKTDLARKAFKDSGLTYAHLTRARVQKLRFFINEKMKESELMESSYRCKQRAEFRPDKVWFWAGIKCCSYYFEEREAVSFNRDGFIGFCGWADSKHEKPVLEGFYQWIEWMGKEVES
jgi:hypothetical protein